MKRPSFQFYVGDWQSNSNLRRCTHEEKGIWIDVMCLLHDQEEYGVVRWTLKEIAQAVGCKVAQLRAIVAKGVMKGADIDEQVEPFGFRPRHAGSEGAEVILVANQPGPLWYSSRMVRDEYIKANAGVATRFTAEKKKQSPYGLHRPALRKKVHAKTGGTCFYCETSLQYDWEMDHYIPVSKGGKNAIENLVPACRPCNQAKKDTLPHEFVSPCRRVGENHASGKEITSHRQDDGPSIFDLQSSTSESKKETTDSAVSEDAAPPDPVLLVIRAFDAARVEVFGKEHQRAFPAADDRVYAERFLGIGADIPFLKALFLERMAGMLKDGGKKPKSLKYFDDAVPEAYSRFLGAKTKPLAKPAVSAPSPYAGMTREEVIEQKLNQNKRVASK